MDILNGLLYAKCQTKKYDMNCSLYLEKFSMYTIHQYKNQQKKVC